MSETEQVLESNTTDTGSAKVGCGAILGILFVILLFIGWITGGTIEAPRADVELRLAQGVAGRVFYFHPLVEEFDGEKVSVGFARVEASQMMGVSPGDTVSSDSIDFVIKMVATDGPVVFLYGPDEQIVQAAVNGWPVVNGLYMDRTIKEMAGVAAAVDPSLDQNEFYLWIKDQVDEFSSAQFVDGEKKVVRRSFDDLGANLTITREEVFTDTGMKPGINVIVGLLP